MRVFQFLRVGWQAGAFQIAWRGINAQLQVGHPAGHQRLVGDFTAAHDAIDVLADDIHDAVADAHVQLNVGISGVECR
ncbi:hypothetical protein G6F60_015761 [Rhizopus arrhizus]|nr:hypothetical protein G6F65_020282 [Rhizopus arrhizus]KAG1364995.1 hypothetical protein G6F60_015761 [Rhizopus arrhizus]